MVKPAKMSRKEFKRYTWERQLGFEWCKLEGWQSYRYLRCGACTLQAVDRSEPGWFAGYTPKYRLLRRHICQQCAPIWGLAW